MAIRFASREARHDPAETIAALQRASGAPRRLCEWAWEESLEDRKSALELLERLAPYPSSHEAAGHVLEAVETPLRRARVRGRDRARADLGSRRFFRLSFGLLRDPPSFCPSCRVRIAYAPDRSDVCSACGTALFHSASTGCVIDPSTRPFVEAYRAEVDAYLRKRFPRFSWKDVDA